MSAKDLLSHHPLLGDRTRLAIMVLLSSSEEELGFNVILEALGLTKGNLSSHMKKLEDQKLIKVKKQFVDRKSNTTFSTSVKGKEALTKYIKQIQSLIIK